MVSVRSLTTVEIDAGRNGLLQFRNFLADLPHDLDDVGAGLALDVDDDRGLALIPARRSCSFSSPSMIVATSPIVPARRCDRR